MKFSKISRLLALSLLIFGAVSCGEPTAEQPIVEPEPAPYGYFYLGDEEIPVNAFSTVEDGLFLLKLSPLEDILTATTYVIVGVRSYFMGEEIDVETKWHNDDYVVVYEDPTRYYSPQRPLQSGTILLDRNVSGVVRAKIDVVLTDGTRLTYENQGLKPL